MDARLFDQAIFSQVLDMDDDTERTFSKELVISFFTQAEKTLAEMNESL
jgi:hypothetical protein